MSIKTCKQHRNEPIFIYAECAACEIQRYRNQVDALKSENESLRKDAERYRFSRDEMGYSELKELTTKASGYWDDYIDEISSPENPS